MLEVEDVEDVACTVDDMDSTNQREWSEGRGRVKRGFRVRIDGRVGGDTR
jgi:hypothetical protein